MQPFPQYAHSSGYGAVPWTMHLRGLRGLLLAANVRGSLGAAIANLITLETFRCRTVSAVASARGSPRITHITSHSRTVPGAARDRARRCSLNIISALYHRQRQSTASHCPICNPSANAYTSPHNISDTLVPGTQGGRDGHLRNSRQRLFASTGGIPRLTMNRQKKGYCRTVT